MYLDALYAYLTAKTRQFKKKKKHLGNLKKAFVIMSIRENAISVELLSELIKVPIWYFFPMANRF